MKRAGGAGGNGQKNDAGQNIDTPTTRVTGKLQDEHSVQNNDIKAGDTSRGNAATTTASHSTRASSGGQGGSYSTGTSSGGGGSTAANYAATNRAEENALAAQKAQPNTGTTANYAATNTPSSTASTGTTTGSAASNTGTTTASTATGNNPSTVSNSTSSDSTVRLANKGIGDDSAAIKQKYAGLRGNNSPNRTA